MSNTQNDNGNLLDIFASISLTLGDTIAQSLEKERRKAQRAVMPVMGRIVQSVTLPASGTGVMRLGGPDQGHFWWVRSLAIGGLSPTVAAAGRADVYISAMDLRTLSPLANLGLADWRDQAVTLPQIAFYGGGAMGLRLNEEMFIVITNGTVGQQYVCGCAFLDYQESAADQEFGLS